MKYTMISVVSTLSLVLFLSSCKKSNPADSTDTTAPVVSISTPLQSSVVTDSTVIEATASDNKGIEKIEFYIDSGLVSTLSSGPCQYRWDVRGLPSASAHTIQVKAYDGSGNIGSSPVITVSTRKTVQALLFNGLSDFVTLPSSASLTSFTNKITIEAWVKISSYGADIIASGNENEYAFGIAPDGRVGVTMVLPNPQLDHEFRSKSTISLNTWHHLAFTYDGSTETIFINGTADTSFTTNGNVSTGLYTENISVGAYSWNNFTQHSAFLNGYVDDLRVWNVSRTPAEIQTGMSSELSGSETGLVGYWTMNGNVADKTVNANHGTIVGTPTFIVTTR